MKLDALLVRELKWWIGGNRPLTILLTNVNLKATSCAKCCRLCICQCEGVCQHRLCMSL